MTGKEQQAKTTSAASVQVPQWQSFAFATVAPQLAVVFTNPFDTAKVRLQLQAKEKIYKNTFDCMYKILKNEGITSLQKGITPAILREGTKNLFRIGCFEPLLNYLHDKKEGKAPMWKRIVAGSVSGAMGALSCNPFELVKTRFQAHSKNAATAVGHQHHYSGMFSAFRSIVKQEGFLALYKGSGMSMMRSVIGSGANLSVYSWLREYVLSNQMAADNSLTDTVCSMLSALVSAVLMNPVDVLRTRLYNQPVDPVTKEGMLYKNGADAVVKVVRTEGPQALMKGVFSSFMRLGPHFTLTFVFFEQMKRMSANYEGKKKERELRTLFNKYDKDGNQKLDEQEIIEIIQQLIPQHLNYRFLSNLEYDKIVKSTATSLLQAADKDKSGSIEFNEFAELKSNLEKVVKENEYKAAFSVLDKQHTGTIDPSAASEVVKSLMPADRYKNLTREEYEHKLRSDVNRMIKMVAKQREKGEGITYDEFKNLAELLHNTDMDRVVHSWMKKADVW